MKKILIITILATFMASQAFAAGSATLAFQTMDKASTGKTVWGDPADTDATTAVQIGKCSSGVSVAMFTDVLGYGAMTQHTNGTKTFASSHDSTSIYSKPAVVGTTPTAPSAIGTASFSSWTAM